jgi:signal peptidase II
MPRVRRAVIFLAIFVCTTGFDQGSKQWAQSNLPAGEPQPVIDGYWDWQLAQNEGVAFSSFQDGGQAGAILLSLVAAFALVGIGIVAARTRPEERMKRAAYALIAGGALGNLIDRVREGAVTDFIRWHVHEHMWPIFNVADAALLVGVVLLLLESAVAYRRRAMLRT